MPPFLSRPEARRLVVDAQGLSRLRATSPVTRAHLRKTIEALGMVQLDAINVVARTQHLVPFSRLGAYDVDRLDGMTGPGGELFEYWGRAAAWLPTSQQPLFRWRMEQHGPAESRTYVERRQAWEKAHAGYLDAVLHEVRDRGPLAASQLSDPRRRDGEWWDRRSVGRLALEWLFAQGEVAAWRTTTFERVYDLPERVIPAAVLAQPTPTVDEAHRRLLVLAARALGVATVRDLANHYLLKQVVAKARIAELLEAGELVAVSVDGWRETAYRVPRARPVRPKREHATLLSPFDSLIWDRARCTRIFDFDYRIEVYTPQPKRSYGYFVLPLLLGDELVGRFDLKADRKASALRVLGAYLEPGAAERTVATAAAVELDALRDWLNLGKLNVARKGNLATALRRAVD